MFEVSSPWFLDGLANLAFIVPVAETRTVHVYVGVCMRAARAMKWEWATTTATATRGRR